MAKLKLTPWFDYETNPVKKGVYETRHAGGDKWFQHWNGKVWACVSREIEYAARNEGSKSMYQNIQWRGLAEQPKEQKK